MSAARAPAWRCYGAAFILAWCGLPVAATGITAAAPVTDEVHFFAIPPQALETALIAYAEQASVQILFRPDLLKGQQSPGINGAYKLSAAIAALLAGTDLTIEFVGVRTVLVGNPDKTAKSGAPAQPR